MRLLLDRGELAGDVDVPDSVQALIAARLDTLSPERKRLLQDAAVLGKVFWAGVLAEMAGREVGEIELALHELSRKELVRRARTSSMEGESEYSFWHLLVREVCYAQIPRAARAARHRAAAAWIEGKAGERAEDLADVLAHHYLQALELARASGQADDLPELETKALRYPRPGRGAGARARRRERRAEAGQGARARSRGPRPARLPARALGAGGSAAEPTRGGTRGTRGSARALPGARRERRRRAGADRSRGRAAAPGRSPSGGGGRAGPGAARGAGARARARRRLRATIGDPLPRGCQRGCDCRGRAGARARRRARPARAGSGARLARRRSRPPGRAPGA